MSDCALEIAKKMFQTSPINKLWRMHRLAGLTSIGDVRTSKI